MTMNVIRGLKNIWAEIDGSAKREREAAKMERLREIWRQSSLAYERIKASMKPEDGQMGYIILNDKRFRIVPVNLEAFQKVAQTRPVNELRPETVYEYVDVIQKNNMMVEMVSVSVDPEGNIVLMDGNKRLEAIRRNSQKDILISVIAHPSLDKGSEEDKKAVLDRNVDIIHKVCGIEGATVQKLSEGSFYYIEYSITRDPGSPNHYRPFHKGAYYKLQPNHP